MNMSFVLYFILQQGNLKKLRKNLDNLNICDKIKSLRLILKSKKRNLKGDKT